MAKRIWSFAYGPRGFGVLAFLNAEAPSIMLEYRVQGKRKYLNLEHKDRKRAQSEAKDFVTARMEATPTEPKPEPLPTTYHITVGELFRRFRESEYAASLTEKQQQANRTKLGLWESYLGPSRTVRSLDEESVKGFLNARKLGRRGLPKARGQQTHYNDFSALRAAIQWGMRTRNGGDEPILPSNPLQGVSVAMEKNWTGDLIDHKTYLALRRAARTLINPAIRVFLITAEATGKRENGVRLLRWSDVDFEKGGIWWMAEVEVEGEAVKADKEGYRDFVQAAPRLLAVLKRWKQQNPETEWVFESRRRVGRPQGRPYSLTYISTWPDKLYDAAGLEKPRLTGWHAFRRKMATELDMAGYSLAAIQLVTGHRSIESLLRYIQRDKKEVAHMVSRGRVRV